MDAIIVLAKLFLGILGLPYCIAVINDHILPKLYLIIQDFNLIILLVSSRHDTVMIIIRPYLIT